jgi:hypothetical protein
MFVSERIGRKDLPSPVEKSTPIANMGIEIHPRTVPAAGAFAFASEDGYIFKPAVPATGLKAATFSSGG